MSRRFAGVGIVIGATRLREIAAGAPAPADEMTDVEFAMLTSELVHDQRLAKFERGKRCCTRCLLTIGVGLVMLSSLVCMIVLLFSLMLHTMPF